MTNNLSQQEPTSSSHKGFLSKHAWKFLAGIGVIVFLTTILFGGEAKAMFFTPSPPQECSQPPEPYTVINKQSAHDKDGDPIYIVRAVVGSGEGTIVEGSSSYPFPDCHSEDPAFVKVVDLDVILDSNGKEVNIIVGIVGMWQPENPPEEQP